MYDSVAGRAFRHFVCLKHLETTNRRRDFRSVPDTFSVGTTAPGPLETLGRFREHRRKTSENNVFVRVISVIFVFGLHQRCRNHSAGWGFLMRLNQEIWGSIGDIVGISWSIHLYVYSLAIVEFATLRTGTSLIQINSSVKVPCFRTGCWLIGGNIFGSIYIPYSVSIYII